MKYTEQNLTQTVTDFIKGELTPQEISELENWCQESDENRAEYKLALLMAKGKQIKQGEHLFSRQSEAAYLKFITKTRQKGFRKRKRPEWSFVRYAAAAIVLLGAGIGIGRGSLNQPLAEAESKMQSFVYQVEIPNGSKGKVILPDGTLVWLNSGSTLSYTPDFGLGHRTVELNGEGNFDVTRNEKIPFIVQGDKITARVYGTKFNFKSYTGDLMARVTLIEGSLTVVNTLKKGDTTQLQPNQQAMLITSVDKNTSLAVNQVSGKDYQEWTKESRQEVSPQLMELAGIARKSNITLPALTPNNSILFDNEPVFQIIKDLERMYNIKIELKNESVLQRHFYGNFRNDESLYDILEIIARTNNLKYKISDNTIQFY